MRAIIYDRTCVGGRGGNLTRWWSAGAQLYERLDRIDATFGATSWDEALGWLATAAEPIREVQYWGHGKWGCALIDDDVLGASSLPRLAALRERLAPGALVWFRTCETFGARRGLEFAERLAGFLGARVAGHTHVIHFYQSGLQGLAPGMRPAWSADEGLVAGTADEPQRARSSTPWAPHTITCLAGRVPERWFARHAAEGCGYSGPANGAASNTRS